MSWVSRSRSAARPARADRDMGSDRKRSISPVVMSVTEATAVPGAVIGQPHPEHPADQVLVVVPAAGKRDGAAEHVGEQQHEDDRLEVTSISVSARAGSGRRLRPVEDATSADEPGASAAPGARPARRGASWRWSCRGTPRLSLVLARSPSVARLRAAGAGQGEEHVVERGPAQASRRPYARPVERARPTSVSSRRSASAVTCSCRGSASTGPVACLHQRPRRRPGRRRRVSATVDPLAADLRLELVGGALGDHPAGVDAPRSGRPAGRPPPGTGWSAAASCRRRPARG